MIRISLVMQIYSTYEQTTNNNFYRSENLVIFFAKMSPQKEIVSMLEWKSSILQFLMCN